MQPSDFLRPTGRLQPKWLGGPTEASTTLTALITAAEAITADEAVQECFVYWKAFQQIADGFMAGPSMQRDRNKTSQWSSDQINLWVTTAREYHACFQRGLSGSAGFQVGTTVQKGVTPTW